jgi:hypothetical protein
VKRIERVDASYAFLTKELNRDTIKTAERAFVAAEFTIAICRHPPAFESDKFFEK